MNQDIHRVVYNEARGGYVVADEHARSDGAGGSFGSFGSSTDAAADFADDDTSPVWFAARATAFAALCTFGMQPVVASAQPTLPIAPTFPGTTSIGTSSNGTPVVNIAKPNQSGLSNNYFDQYNVGTKGVVLNNSAQATQTQIGGTVQGNTAVGQQGANLILLQVTGGSPTQLLGTTEVAGKGANLVIANPSGIECGGCGFLNAPRVTLTTGTPLMDSPLADQQTLAGFDVRKGKISVTGDGLSAPDSKLDLIARAITVNGKIHASEINVIGAASKVDYQTNKAASTYGDDAGPDFAIDVGALGSMYSDGAVRLISNERGVGVRNNGQIGSLGNEIRMSADGDIVIGESAKVGMSDEQLNVTAKNVTNQGVLAAGTVTMNADDIVNTGTMDSRYGTFLQAKDKLTNSGVLKSDNAVILGGVNSLTLDGGTLQAGGNILASGKSVSNRGGTMNAKGQVEVDATSLDNTGGTIKSNDKVMLKIASLSEDRGVIEGANGTEIGSGDASRDTTPATPDQGDGEHTSPDQGSGEHTNPDQSGSEHTSPDQGGGEHTNPDQGSGEHAGLPPIDMITVVDGPGRTMQVPRDDLNRWGDVIQLPDGRYATRNSLASLGLDSNGNPSELVSMLTGWNQTMNIPRADLSRFSDLVQLPNGVWASRSILAKVGMDEQGQPIAPVQQVGSPIPPPPAYQNEMVEIQTVASGSVMVPRGNLNQFADLVQIAPDKYAPRSLLASIGFDQSGNRVSW
jgi:filamentous hemagglutinin family protein